MVLKLIVTKGQDEGKILYVRSGESKIMGRSSKTDLVVRDIGVSRLHCQIKNDGVRCTIADMNSKNGTAVNNRRILEETPLFDHYTVEIGTSRLAVRIVSEEEAPSAMPGPPSSQVPATAQGPAAEPVPQFESHPPTAPSPAEEEPPVLDLEEEGQRMGVAARAEPVDEDAQITIEAPDLDLSEPAPSDAGAADEADEVMGSFEPWLESQSPGSGGIVVEDEDQAVVVTPEAAGEVAAESLTGKVIAGFRLEEEIGRDEMSTIYRAVQVSMDRTVTVKILAADMTRDEQAVTRFIRAARSGGQLVHPNIVQVYDAGEAEGLYYIALEHVEGDTLKALLQARGLGTPLTTRQALDIAAQVAGALAHAHSRKIVHRNIRPHNVIVTGHGVAKIADMGFAKSLADAGLKRATLPGERLGDMQYAAPEQLTDARLADERADVYSLGAVLFIMLSGRPPFHGDSEADIMAKVQAGQAQDLRQLNPRLPIPVCVIVKKAMMPDPAQRYQAAAELAADLGRARDAQ